MADFKISQLTNATTPLAGTEVVPVVQSNSTVKVSVANLTAGRAISCTGLTTLDTVGISTSKVIGSGNGYAGNFSAFSYGTLTLYDADGAVILNSQTNLSGAGVKIQTLGVTNLWVRNTGNVDIPTGNLVINTASKGVTLPGGITWTSGSGSPESVVTAPIGSLYSRTDGGVGTSLYVKQSGTGNTGWVGK
jgi:hypothetical protein